MSVEKSNSMGKRPSSDDIFYLQWGKDTLKNNINLANDILKQIITLSTALLGVSIIVKDIVQTDLVRGLVLLLFFLSLIISFLGVLPFENIVNLNSPSEIRQHKQKSLKHKLNYVWTSAFMLALGFIPIFVELIIKII